MDRLAQALERTAARREARRDAARAAPREERRDGGVVERLADAADRHARDALAERFDRFDLADQLLERERTREAVRAGRAERTADRAADLTRHAQAVAAIEHGLDARTVGEARDEAAVDAFSGVLFREQDGRSRVRHDGRANPGAPRTPSGHSVVPRA